MIAVPWFRACLKNPGAIGYVALPYLNNDKVATVSINNSADPGPNTYSSTYKVWGYEHIYTGKNPKAAVTAFLKFVTGDQYAAHIEAFGLRRQQQDAD